MSKLAKSKFFLGALIVAGFLAVSASHASAAITSTLKVGSRGAEVTELQTALGVTPVSGYFGPITKAAVMTFQTSKGLVADGIFGAKSRAAWTGMSMSYPAGCTSASGFSTTTGASCASASTTLPAGCTSTAGFSPTTGASCSGSSSVSTGPLTGGAGDATLTKTSTDVETTVNEGATATKVYGFKAQADGGDIALTNVKVSFVADGAGSPASSYRLSHYADTVSVWMGSTKVGSASVADFTKDGNTYSKSIALSGATVREGTSHKQTLYVALDAAANIDTSDFAATWTLTVSSIRFQDSTGVVLTADDTALTNNTFDFTSLAASGDVKVVVSKDSSSPIAQSTTVSDTSSTKNVLLLAFKVKATGSDVTFDTLNITTALTTVGSHVLRSDVIGELQLKNGSDTLATIDGASLDGAETFDLDNTFTVAADTTEVFKIYATVNDVSNFDSGESFSASFASFSPEDSNGDVVTDTGSASGSAQTFVNDVPTIAKVGTPTLALYTHTDGTTSGLEDSYKATIKFDVTAPDSFPIYVPLDTFSYGTAGTAGVQYSKVGGATVTSASVQYSGSDDLSGITESHSYRVDAGATQEFTLTVFLTGNDANGKITLTGLSYETAEGTPDNSPTITAPADIYTPLVPLAK